MQCCLMIRESTRMTYYQVNYHVNITWNTFVPFPNDSEDLLHIYLAYNLYLES